MPLLFSAVGSLLGIQCAVNAASFPPPVAVVEVKWNNFSQHKFEIGGHAAYVISPAFAAPGNPWIWRTAWPNYHAEVDLELLRCGYHVGYIEVVDMLGSEPSLDLMDQFYAQVTSQWKLAAKPAIEPNSCGGLHAYRYALRHPERVACILGDVPVMDFKSWPYDHPASRKANWPQVLTSYGFKSEAEAMAYKGNPNDNLDVIAKAKIPLRHTICLTDQIVPPERNTLEAKRRLQKLGWDLDVVAVKESNETEGHHFPFPESFESALFVMAHADVRPAAREYFELRDGLANCERTFGEKKTGRVVFLGGSITYGSGWRDEVMGYLKKKFPETKFDFIAAGIPSVGSNGHAFRMDQDVFQDGPVDLLFVEAAVNDISNLPGNPTLMLRSMEGVIRHARMKNPETDIIQMHFVSPESLNDYAAEKVPEAIAQHDKVAAAYGCVSLNLAKECADRIKAGQMTWEGDFKSNVHPPPFGQQLYSNSMMRMMDAAFDTTKAPAPHSVPMEMLDKASYQSGHYVALGDAILGKGFTLVPEWNPTVKSGTREGFVSVPALSANEAGAEFTYDFEGNAIGLFLASGPDSCILEYNIDGGAFKKLDTFTKWSGSLYLPWPVILADGLNAGKHRLVVKTTDDTKERTGLHVIHVLVN